MTKDRLAALVAVSNSLFLISLLVYRNSAESLSMLTRLNLIEMFHTRLAIHVNKDVVALDSFYRYE